MGREKKEYIVDRRLKEEIDSKEEEEKTWFNFKAKPLSMTSKIEKIGVRYIFINIYFFLFKFYCLFKNKLNKNIYLNYLNYI